MALKLMHRGENHVDLSQVCDKQQQCRNQTTMCCLGKEMIKARKRERDSESVRENELKLELTFHGMKIVWRKRGADMRVFIASRLIVTAKEKASAWR